MHHLRLARSALNVCSLGLITFFVAPVALLISRNSLRLKLKALGVYPILVGILLAEVWIFLVFSEVCDQELASMPCLCSTEAFGRLSTLSRTTSWEHTTIRSLASTLDLNVEDEIDGLC